MQGVEMNPNLYCVSLVVDLWPWETYSNTCSLAQLLLTEPSLPLSPSTSPSLSLSLLTSQSVPLCCNLQPPDTLTFTHTRTHAHIFTCTHSSPPVPSRPPCSDSRLDSHWQVQLDLLLSITADWLSAGLRVATRSSAVLSQTPCQVQTRQGQALWHEGDGWYSEGHKKKTRSEVDVSLLQESMRSDFLYLCPQRLCTYRRPHYYPAGRMCSRLRVCLSKQLLELDSPAM